MREIENKKPNIKNVKADFKQRVYQYEVRLIKFLSAVPNAIVTREIKSQLTRSGTSIGANYFEAEGSSTRKDYQNYFSYALKSANETRYWLSLLRDGDLLPAYCLEECLRLLNETNELAKILAASILTMKSRD